ncbi:MAG: N-6 DNA methylase [Planctomycetes bacterium]|nr:N-6 DNA methylase [Planctomycetota bacterium]
MGAEGAAEERRVAAKNIDRFFEDHCEDLRPESIYNAKTLHRASPQHQLWFVDAGLMPAVERHAGETLHRLVEQSIRDLTSAIGSQLRSRKGFTDLYKTVFWLLAAKLLHEKGVEKFKKINLKNVDEVFDRVGRHYAAIDTLPPGGKQWRPAIDAAAEKIATWGYLGNISTEALGYLYERALIDKKPKGRGAKNVPKGRDIRKELGIHSTPPVLVDHMLAQLWPMIEEIKPEDRSVFEPACGHGAFLVASLRWLREHSGLDEGIKRHRYLCERLYGIERDAFARELGKLSLTLADVPHGNSWHIDEEDMFLPNVLRDATKQCTILLANPPYEPFSKSDRNRYRKAGEPVMAITKAVEMLKRTLPHLPPGGVFGVVMPQGVLYDKESIEMRKLLLTEFELSEISLFADNLFEESDHEVVVLMGRRRKPTPSSKLMYRRVRERGMEAFKDKLAFSSERAVPQASFAAVAPASILLPDLPEVWGYLENTPKLLACAKIQQGFQFLNKSKLRGRTVTSRSRRAGWAKAVLRADTDYGIWALPQTCWIDASKKNFRRPGAATKLGAPQVVLNYAPVAREPWRLKAVVDEKGHAVSSRFLVFRPKLGVLPLDVLWAILNSPVANAYAFCFSGKRETLVKEWRAFPLPPIPPAQARGIAGAATEYLAAVHKAQDAFMKPSDEEAVQRALLAMDAEVLRLYDLPPRLERQLLDLFEGVERKGVGCKFRGYYPPDLDAYVPLHELISEDYARSTLGAFREHPPLDPSSPVLAALRSAAEAFAEE